MTLIEPPISPVYVQSEPSGTIPLGSCHIEFVLGNESYQSNARVELRFVPAARLLFIIPNDGASLPFVGVGHRLIQQKCITVSLPDYGQSFEAFCVLSGSDGTVLVPKTSVITITPASDDISTAIFHLFNFPEFIGTEDFFLVTGEPPQQGLRRCGKVTLRTDGWKITIAATDKTEGLVKALSAEGGYVTTHMGKIERDDGSTFSSQQLCDLLECLYFFFSFALGRWAGVTLPVGLNQVGGKVFEQWGFPRAAANEWNGSCSWFDQHHSELLSELFPGFYLVWNSPLWAETLKTTLYWYVTANCGIGVDTGILLAQIALERLAWTHCVSYRKIATANQFESRGFAAAKKLDMLMQDLSVSTAIPKVFSALRQRFKDGPEAVTRIRNSLVHPRNAISFSTNLYVEAWKLSLWYLDLVMLRICGHKGNYANRCTTRWVGEVEQMP